MAGKCSQCETYVVGIGHLCLRCKNKQYRNNEADALEIQAKLQPNSIRLPLLKQAKAIRPGGSK